MDGPVPNISLTNVQSQNFSAPVSAANDHIIRIRFAIWDRRMKSEIELSVHQESAGAQTNY